MSTNHSKKDFVDVDRIYSKIDFHINIAQELSDALDVLKKHGLLELSIEEKEVKPTTLETLDIKFPNEKSCHKYFVQQRWEDGIVRCANEECNAKNPYVFADGIRFKCKSCRMIFTVQTNSFMHNTKLPSIKWIKAMFMLTNDEATTTVNLSKALYITQKSAWHLKQRIIWAINDKEIK